MAARENAWRDKMREFFNTSPMHGLGSISRSSSAVGRFFWSVVCCAAVVMFIVMTTLNILQFYSYQTTMNLEEVPNGFVPPYVSFCNHRHLSLAALQKFINLLHENQTTVEALAAVDAELRQFVQVQTLLDHWSTHVEENEYLLARETLFVQLSLATINRIGVMSEDFVISCRKGAKKCNLTKSSFIDYSHPFFFKCYIYDPLEGAPLNSSVHEGIKDGHTFVFLSGSSMLHEDAYHHIPGFSNTLRQTGGTDGVRVLVHPRGALPDPLNEGVDAPTGTSVVLGITSKEIKRMKLPYGNCTSTFTECGKLVKVYSKGNKTFEENFRWLDDWGNPLKYSTTECKEICQQRHTMERCGCQDLRLPAGLWPWNHNATCLFLDFYRRNMDLNSCYVHLQDEKSVNLNLTEGCKHVIDDLLADAACVARLTKTSSEWDTDCDCPPACDETQYEVSYSLSRWPASGPQLYFAYKDIVQDTVIPRLEQHNNSEELQFSTYFRDESNIEKVMADFVKVTFYYDSPSVTRMSQIQKYSFVDILSNAGGLMGMWLGISIISLFEFGSFVLSMAVFGCRKLVSQRSNQVEKIRW